MSVTFQLPFSLTIFHFTILVKLTLDFSLFSILYLYITVKVFLKLIACGKKWMALLSNIVLKSLNIDIIYSKIQ